jgi:RNA polymerase-binding transcription factor DksA
MTDIPQEQLQTLLESERALLESQLNQLGREISDGDWSSIPAVVDEAEEDYNTQADRVAEFETDTAILNELEQRHRDVVDALNKMTQGTYGVCEVSGESIEPERLLANPAARTCMAHMNDTKGDE